MMRAFCRPEPHKPRVLIVCAGNSARSQMGEALMRHMAGDRYEVFSAGTHPSTIHPLAIAAMREIGIDMRDHRAKSLEEFRDAGVDLVITVCDRASEACPRYFAGAKRAHWSMPDPAAVEGTEEARIEAFRTVRDSLQYRLQFWLHPDALAQP